jgi:conjugal transfer pilus assembly protein TraW
MNKHAAVGALLAACVLISNAEDLGIKNKTYAPGRDAREQMKDQVRAKQKSGQLDKFWNDYRDKTIDAIKNPAPLGLPTRLDFSSQLRDLKFALPQDYRDQKGRIVARKGQVIEPLKIQPLVYGLIFIDGRDQAQVDYAIAAGRKERLKIVLTAGSPYALRLKYKDAYWNGVKTIPFYFDQRKMIINQLRSLYQVDVNTVPVKLTQSGSQLLVEYGVKR